MDIIGRGWQYTIYDLGNGRVLKRNNTFLLSYFIMLRDAFAYLRPPIFNFKGYYEESKKNAICSLEKISESTLQKSLFGNPKMLGGCDYEQDYATPLYEYFKKSSVEDSKRVIDKFIEFNKMLLGHGIIDKYFNVADNYGLDGSGSLVLIDLGEVCVTEEEIQYQTKMSIWHAKDVVRRLPAELRKYFVERMDIAFKNML